MRVLLRLRRPQILVLQIRKHLRQEVLQFLRRNHVFQPRPVLVVLRDPYVEQIPRPLGVHKLVKVRRRQRVGHLSRAVRPEVEKNHRVIVVDQPHGHGRGCASLGHHDGLHKFIRQARFITSLERRNRIIRPRFRLAMNQRAVSQLDALPAVVAIHRVIAPHQRGDLANTQLAHLLLQLPQVVASAVRRRVASVHETVHQHLFHFLLLGHLQ